ncbi:MAG: hypothetical protein HYX63_07115 [Gammaproteobacteria bacterium]|nr:hypothetical protein [Gammaproteobacteria bacterium]
MRSVVGAIAALSAMTMVLVGCASNPPPPYTPPPGTASPPVAYQEPSSAPLSTQLKLDVGIDVFDPGIEGLDSDQHITTPSVRRAEAHYLPTVLANTLERRGVWGRVRLSPHKQSEMDLWIDGRILDSDGTRLKLSITVTAATGQVWYTREYDEQVERYVYDADPTHEYRDPLQGIYERIADDLQHAAAKRDGNELREAQAVAQLLFARRFAPEQFGDYLAPDAKGQLHVKRLPAVDDPAVRRMADLRARDLMFVDQVDTYFDDFNRNMQPSYDRWRQASHDEVSKMKSLKTQGMLRKIGGALAMLGGLAAMTASNNSGLGVAGVAGMAGGAYLFSTGVDKSEEAKIHEAALAELADSLGTSMKPHHIELSNRTVTLTGTVEEQYAQWRGLLADIYRNDNGQNTNSLPIITSDPLPNDAAK